MIIKDLRIAEADIWANSAKEFYAPNLETAWDIYVESAEIIEL